MKRRLRENIEIGDSVFVSSDEYQGTVIDINGDEVLVDGPFGEEYFDINDLEKLGGDYEEDETPNFFKKRFTESKRKNIIRLTERDLSKIVKRVINEMDEKEYRVVMMSKDTYNSSPSVESDTISEFSEETDEMTFEGRGAALRHAENMFEENPDDSIVYIIVDNNNEPYGSVPGLIRGPLTRRFTGFHKGY
jgi:hypothetical protein